MHDINPLNSISNDIKEFDNKSENSGDKPTYNSLFDKNKNGVIEIVEQKTGIMQSLNKLLEADINEYFNSDIKYNKLDKTSVDDAELEVKNRRQKAITLANSTKYFNRAILDKGSTVFHEKMNPEGKEIIGSTMQYGEKIEFSTTYNKDNSYFRRYSDASIRYYNQTGRWTHGITSDGQKYMVSLKKDGTYDISTFNTIKTFSKEGNLLNINKDGKTYNFSKHTYGINLQTGHYLNTGSVDINSLQGDVSINGEIENSEQGELGDCFFLAQINALANTEFGKTMIKNSIVDNNNGTFTVKLKGANEEYTISKQEILYAKTLKSDGESTYSKGDDDMVLLELAFEQHFNHIKDFVDDSYLEDTKQELLKTKNSKGETFECRSMFSYGGFGGDLATENTGTDIAFLLSGKEAFKGFSLDKNNNESISALLKLKAIHNDNVAITFGLGEFKDSSKNKIAKEYQDFYSERHLSSITEVALNENQDVESITITNPWDNNKSITVPYDKFIQEWISKTTDNDIWIASDSTEVNTQVEELSNTKAQEFSDSLKSQKNSGDIYKMFKDDNYTSRARILKEYGGMKKVLEDLLKETPNEWNRLKERGHTKLSLEEYQANVIEVFINHSGLFKDISDEEYSLIHKDFEIGVKSYCMRHGYQY